MKVIHDSPCSRSVVIPTWNGGARFVRLLEILGEQQLEDGFELIVIDSGSNDETPEAARAAGARVIDIPQAEFGHGRTRNRAMAESSGELIALLTQDALPMDNDYLANLFGALDDESIDGAYARQFPLPDCDPLIAERLRLWSASRNEPVIQEFVPGDAEASVLKFEALPPIERYLACAYDNVASCMRRSTWEQFPYPERSFGEDVAWAREVLRAGGRIAFEPTARVEHSHNLQLGREFKRIYCDHSNLIALFGLHNVPTWGDVFRGWKYQRNFYRELLNGMDLPTSTRLYWRMISIPHALFETAAQFLGARSHWKTEQSSFWAWADRRIRRGV
ncbi:MAG: glycosyltransferase involved in cell wall biosynthesis [Planctomycetota bacterium]|jgi:glycosyltransferase involved in cell wall biosynthesis